MPQCDGYSALNENLKVYGAPFKSLTNVDWLHAMYRAAGASGCRVLLTGQYGNATISWGKVEEYFGIMVKRGRIIKAFKAVYRNARLKELSRKLVLKTQLARLIGSITPKGRPKSFLDSEYIGLNLNTAKELNITDYDTRLNENNGHNAYKLHGFEEIRALMTKPEAFAHISEPETQFSLESGLVLRDPSRDIRIIEFCLSIPLECFVNDKPETRRLVRCYCAELLPKAFLPEAAPRGRQSADTIARLLANWDSIYADINRVFSTGKIYRYLDKDMLGSYLKKFEVLENTATVQSELLQLGKAYAVALFLEQEDMRKG